MGVLSIRFQQRTLVGQAFLALSSLYAATALFGSAVGAADVAFGVNGGPGWQRIAGAVVLQDVVALLWGLTFSGYFLLLWPLAWANHRLVAQLWRARQT